MSLGPICLKINKKKLFYVMLSKTSFLKKSIIVRKILTLKLILQFFLTYIKNLLLETLNDKNNILYQLFDIKKLKHFIENSESIEVPWFGQLMMGPQLLAYFYQIYMWGKIYHIELEL